MKKAVITVGLGFGDEGKGATVDFLTRRLGADLVVRYCGGAQAGHNVEDPDGRRHTFSQFGAGTLAGARTYLGPRMIISPTTMIPEAGHLRSIGVDDPWSLLSAHPNCLIATGYHAVMNRAREMSRGNSRHGSCGMGIGESRHYWLRYGRDAVHAGDLVDREDLVDKLMLMRDRFLLEMQDLPRLDRKSSSLMRELSPVEEADVLRRAVEGLAIESTLPRCEAAIFEGAQGILLDEWKGFHPYTTWSTVTPQHALELLADHPDASISVIGVTRACTTRHGAGPFPSWCPDLSGRMVDRGNPHNEWQGAIRFGPLDLVLLEYAARVGKVEGIFVNCLDQLPKRARVVTEYDLCDRLDEPTRLSEQQGLTTLLESVMTIESEVDESGILDRIAAISPIVGLSHGPTWKHRELIDVGPGVEPRTSAFAGR